MDGIIKEIQLLGILSFGFFHKIKGYCSRYQLHVDYLMSGLSMEAVRQLQEAAPEESSHEILSFFRLVDIVYSSYFKEDNSNPNPQNRFSSLLAEVISSAALNLGIRCSCSIDPAFNNPLEYRRIALAGAGLLLSALAVSGNGSPNPDISQPGTSRDVYHGLKLDHEESYFFHTFAESDGWTAVFSKGKNGIGQDIIQDFFGLRPGCGFSFFTILSFWNGKVRNNDAGEISFFVPYTNISN